MYDYLTGDVVHVEEMSFVLACGHTGYKVMASTETLRDVGQDPKMRTIYTELVVKEDSMQLVGFASREERSLFHLLTSVSGVGMKVALAIMGTYRMGELVSILGSGDHGSLTKVTGVGKKTAQRLVLELKDKIQKDYEVVGADATIVSTSPGHSEAFDALAALGFTSEEVRYFLKNVDVEKLSTQEIVKIALRNMTAKGGR